MIGNGKKACFVLIFVCAVPCAFASESPIIKDVPHVTQKPDYCGEACVASWLQKRGVNATQDDVFNASGLDPALGRGCYSKELVTAIRQLGFDPGQAWYKIPVRDKVAAIERSWQAMIRELQAGVPSVVCMRTSAGPDSTEHFRLILGYDAKSDEIVYHEPAVARAAYQRMPRKEFIDLWPLKYDPNEWLIVRFALKQVKQPTIVPAKSFTNSDYAQHVLELKKKLPNQSFSIVIEHPFVVIGDEAEHVVAQRAAGTVRWATTRLKRQYFKKDPNQILNVWLFKDKQSYDANTLRLFGKTPSTPYGYYSSTDGALVMNIATGGGTLVHEIVHPFIESNFPACPSWFNEGLGSLYEQSSSREQEIVGLTNWRLAGLQRAIKAKKVPSFAVTCGTSTNQFYRQDPGTNYSQSRYLCYYLQEKGLLNKYYHSFRANHESDPTGYKTLQQVLGTNDMAAFKIEWEKFVMNLRFR